MIGILNRWRQFGRRYFWPHLLLGMVAASIGVPHAASERHTLADTPVNSLSVGGAAARFNGLALLQEHARRHNVNVDYWHQHAIRTVIRHLSFSLTPISKPLDVNQQVLLDTLNTLLHHEIRQPARIRFAISAPCSAPVRWLAGRWLADIQGIRAGPYSLT